MIFLRQSTASQEVLLGPFLDDTDGKTAETGLTIANTDIKIWKRGGTTEASKNSGGATHIAAGRYYAVLDATDTDTVGELLVNVHVSGALPVRLVCCVLEEAVFDDLFAASAGGYLKPTTAGRTLDVSATGEAGLDFTNRLDTTGILPNVVAGGVGGLFIAGTNAATTITTSGGSALTLTSSGANGSGLVVTGNGSGSGVLATGGATGHGFRLVATGGAGLSVTTSGASNYAIEATGTGATDSGGFLCRATTAGDGAEFVAGGNAHGLYVMGAGTGEGLHCTGGSGATGDGALFESGGNAASAGIRLTGGSGGKGLNLATAEVGVVTGTSLTLSGAFQAATITSTGATTLNSLAVTTTLTAGATTFASLTVSAATTLTGAVSLGSTLAVTGAITAPSVTLTGVFQAATIVSTGTTTLNALTVTNALLVSGTTTLTGAVSAPAGIAANITGNITGNVSGSVGSIANNGIAAASFAAGAINAAAIADGAIDAATFAAGAIDAAAIATDAIDADALKADAVTEIWAKAMAELSAVPGVTGTVLEALSWVFTLARNKITQTATQQIVYKDDTTTPLGTSGVTDDATTFTRGEFG